MNYGKETWDKNILKSGELIEDSVSEKISATAAVGDVMLHPPIAYPWGSRAWESLKLMSRHT